MFVIETCLEYPFEKIYNYSNMLSLKQLLTQGQRQVIMSRSTERLCIIRSIHPQLR
jgi:hypothetical protein